MDSHVQLGCYTLVRRVLFVWIRQLATWQQPIPIPATQFWRVHNALMVGGYIIGRWWAGLYHYSPTVTSVGWRISWAQIMGYFRLPVTTGNASLTQLPKHFAFLPPPSRPPFVSAGHACCGDQNQSIHLSIDICIDISFHPSIHPWVDP